MGTAFSWTTNDHLTIYGIDWPCPQPRAVVGIVHGLGEHVHRYEHVVAHFHKHQLAAIGYDRRGHGRSGGQRGHTLGIEAFLDEIAHLAVEAEARYPGVPLVLYGHSMGGNLLLNYILRRHPTIQGAIVTAPHITLAFQPSALMVGMGKLMKNIFPGFTQANGLDVNQLSRDKAVIAAYQADPHVHDRLTAKTGMCMLDAAAFLNQYSGAFPVPLLLMHGAADGITSPDGTRAFASRISGPVTLKIWDGLYHEIHNEPEQAQVLDTMTDWIAERVL